jgi:hypothetical protein
MVEQVKYNLIKSLNDVEIRFYDKLVIAKVEGHGDGGVRARIIPLKMPLKNFEKL